MSANMQMKVGLLGEKLQIFSEEGSTGVQWANFANSSQSLTWYKVNIKNKKK